MKRLFLIDAYAQIFRAYYAFIGRPMRSPDGLNTSAIFGFTKFLTDLIKRERPRYLGVAFDPHGGNFRHQLYPEYKANREATPEDIILATPYIKRILEAMHIPVLEIAGYEADDVIGTLSQKASKEGFEVFMVTPDKDFGQLIRPNVHIYKQRKGNEGIEIVNQDSLKEHYGIDSPQQIIDILALWGDAADNIPGVPGIGEKSASKLISQFGSVENIVANIDQLKGKQKENIQTYSERIALAKKLATIDIEAPIAFEPDKLMMECPDNSSLANIYRQLGFTMFLRELESGIYDGLYRRAECEEQKTIQPSPSDLFSSTTEPTEEQSKNKKPTPIQSAGIIQGDLFSTTPAPANQTVVDTPSYGRSIHTIADTPHNYHIVADNTQLTSLISKLQAHKKFCFDTETTGFDPFKDRIIGISFAIDPYEAWYLPIDKNNQQAVFEQLKPLFEDPSIEKIGQNLKFDITMLRASGILVAGPLADTMILHYLLDPESRHGMDYLSRTYLDYDPIAIETLIGRGANQLSMDQIAVEIVAEYAAEDADVTLQLYNILWKRILEAGMERLYRDIEEPLIRVLSDMEFTGVKIDVESLNEYGNTLRKELTNIASSIRQMCDDPSLNIDSPRQLGIALFEKLKIDEKPKKTKTGQYKTDEETLQMLAENHPVVPMILEYRGLGKLLSTYIEALPQLVNPITGRIHTSYNQAVTATGRLSSNNPNLQNIPIRDERGRHIRKAFIPSDEEHVILAVDYSQVELRLMAHLSGDQALIEAFKNGEDIHSATAARIFGVPIDQVTSDMRRKSKTANFGIIYGISTFGLAQRLNIPRAEARVIIEGYFNSYPGVKQYMENIISQAKNNGYVETLFGRKRFLPDINSSNAVVRGIAERNAINAPIQGSAADIMKMAMRDLHRRLAEEGLKSKITMQVHDELVIDTLRSELDRVRQLVIECMEGAAALSVRLEADAGIGSNWLEAH